MNRSPIMMIFPILLLLGIYASGFAYISSRILRFLRAVIPSGSAVSPIHVLIGLCVFYILSIAAGFIPTDKNIQKHFVWFAWVMIGFGLYLLMMFLLSDMVIGIGRITNLMPSPIPKNAVIISFCVVFALSILLTVISIYNAKQLHHISYSVTINTKDLLVGADTGGQENTSSETIKAVLVADTHLGYLNDYKWMEKIAQEINTQNPDIVFFAGDIFNDNFNALAYPDRVLDSLLSINSKYGKYAVLGNHDSGSTYPDMVNLLEHAGITVLQDEHVIIDDRFIVLGRSDPSPIRGGPEPRREPGDVLSVIDPEYGSLPVIVLDHQPGFIDEFGGDVDLILAGHTHRGIMHPATFITSLVYEADYGYFQKTPASVQVITTSGAGLWGPPFRLGSINEVVSIDIVFE